MSPEVSIVGDNVGRRNSFFLERSQPLHSSTKRKGETSKTQRSTQTRIHCSRRFYVRKYENIILDSFPSRVLSLDFYILFTVVEVTGNTDGNILPRPRGDSRESRDRSVFGSSLRNIFLLSSSSSPRSAPPPPPAAPHLTGAFSVSFRIGDSSATVLLQNGQRQTKRQAGEAR